MTYLQHSLMREMPPPLPYMAGLAGDALSSKPDDRSLKSPLLNGGGGSMLERISVHFSDFNQSPSGQAQGTGLDKENTHAQSVALCCSSPPPPSSSSSSSLSLSSV